MTPRRSLRDRLVEQIRFADGHAEIWRLFEDGTLFRDVIDALALPWENGRPTKVAGIEGRGFILGAAVARRFGTGFVAIRKAGPLLAGSTVETATGQDYRGREQRLRLRKDSLAPGDLVLLVDDWCETGAQAAAAMRLIETCGAEFLGLTVIVDELPTAAASTFPRFRSLIRAGELQTDI